LLLLLSDLSSKLGHSWNQSSSPNFDLKSWEWNENESMDCVMNSIQYNKQTNSNCSNKSNT
jgi:hypothetical protein